MKITLYSFFLFFTFFTFNCLAQVTTNSGSGLAATYPNLEDAITALNAATITSPVIILVDVANPQTAPLGGYVITAQGTSSNTITINGNTNIVSAFSSQTIGSLNDAVFKLVGADFIILENFTIQEDAANLITTPASNDMTEWGIALLYNSTSNGAQNNTIHNNTISLNKSYSNTFGIYSNTAHEASNPTLAFEITASTGANSFNKFYSNNINNVNAGIALLGSGSTVAGLQDNSNDIGGTSVGTGNTITNWGGLTPASSFVNNSISSYSIFIYNQYNDNISFNTITSAAVVDPPITFRGILKSNGATQPFGTI